MITLCAATIGRADDASDIAKAKSLNDDAVTNYNLGHFEEALKSFEAAYRIRHDPAFLFNIGQCQRNLKRYEEARRSYGAYLRESPDVPQDSRVQIQQIINDLNRALLEQHSSQPANGTPSPADIRSTPATTVQPGPSRLELTRDPTADESRGARAKRIAGIAIGGFGILSLGLGGAFTALANDANRHIVDGDTWSASAEDRRNMYEALDVAFFTIGGVAVATGLVLYVVGSRQEHRRRPAGRAETQSKTIANAAGAL